MIAVDCRHPGQSLRLGKLSIALLPVLAFALIQGCATISGKIASVPTPEISPPPKGVTVYIGNASWYGPGFNGKITASGSPFDETKLTAAHKTIPLGSRARVINLSNGKSIVVEINDRGPYADGRIIDLSQAAAKALGIVDHGIARVRVEVLDSSVSASGAAR